MGITTLDSDIGSAWFHNMLIQTKTTKQHGTN